MQTGRGIQWQLTLAFIAATLATLTLAGVALFLVALFFRPAAFALSSLYDLAPPDRTLEGMAPLLTLLGLTLAGILVVSSLFAYLAAREITRRLRVLNRAAIAIGLGDLNYRVPSLGDDEFGDLADHFNGMASQLKANASDLQRLAAIEERNRLASDLHDSVNQQIFTINLLAATARRTLTKDPAKATAQMQQLEALARDAHGEMRTLIHALRPNSLEQGGLVGALSEQLRTVTSQAGLQISTDLSGGEGLRLPAERELALLRIAQEALGNAVKHSKANRVRLALTRNDTTLCLTVSDNGTGFDPNRTRDGGLGLQTMRERAAAVGATFDLKTAPGAGTSIAVAVPLM